MKSSEDVDFLSSTPTHTETYISSTVQQSSKTHLQKIDREIQVNSV